MDEMADFTIAEAITNDGAKACSVWASVGVFMANIIWFCLVLICVGMFLAIIYNYLIFWDVVDLH